jgi:c-di-GMP phosphodiesterase
MSENVYIARQPIVDAEDNVYGYELLFRSLQDDGSLKPDFSDEMIATTRVVVNVLNHIGIDDVVGDHFAFINIDQELLLDDILLSIPKERFVIELLEHIKVDKQVIDRVKELKELGYKIALDDAHCDPTFLDNFRPLFPYIDILKLDVSQINLDILNDRIGEFKTIGCHLLAEKVETLEQYKNYKALGCDMFQGYFFAKPDIIKKKAVDPAYKRLFKLINLLDQDTDIDKISIAFEDNPEVTLQLLRFMNSGTLGLNSKIKSIPHAISLLGKKPLKQWLLLIAFSKTDSGHTGLSSPIIELVQSRAKLMSELMKKFSHDNLAPHEAALVGVLSLIDVITGTSLEAILEELDMDEKIEAALLTHEGELGVLLDLALSIESFDIEKANFLLGNLNLSHDTLEAALLASYKSNS